jgi:hypothetical protein
MSLADRIVDRDRTGVTDKLCTNMDEANWSRRLAADQDLWRISNPSLEGLTPQVPGGKPIRLASQRLNSVQD